ncbi:MAG TPA: glycosyltransferase family 4 protein [Synergistaceae bacterium]|nr:glycosyltransferase family 4 protein [Synergistaceae bacterium]HQH77997.1 glycosyltransferase family 4 protein [Synergistaceae bacterium]
MTQGRVVHVFLSNGTRESRFAKEAAVVLEEGLFDEVVFVGLHDEGLPLGESFAPGVRVDRMRLWSRKLRWGVVGHLCKYVEWVVRALHAVRRNRPRVVHCHSLPALPVGVAAKMLWGVPVLYDAHELETEMAAFSGGKKAWAKRLERWLIGRVDAFFVVGDAIADWYVRAYGVSRPMVVRNIPRGVSLVRKEAWNLRQRLSLPPEATLFLFLGGMGPHRGVEEILKAFEGVRGGRHAVFVGDGPLKDVVCRRANEVSNVHYLPPVPPEEVLSVAQGADVGLCLFEKNTLNNLYSLPNKIFEYLFAPIPLIIADLPEQRRIVEAFSCGWIWNGNPEDLVHLVNQLDPAGNDYAEKRAGAERAARELDWDKEVRSMVEAYGRLGGGAWKRS